MEDPEDVKLMKWLDIFNLVTYSFLLVFAGYVIVKYLIIKKKHDITYLTS